MNKRYHYTRNWLLALVICTVAACTKEDIMPAPVGEPVDYTSTATRNWQEVMTDAEFSLFNAAWKRSSMDTWIKNSNAAYHTVFMPTDKAFTDAGWTLSDINAAAPANLDSLLAYYVVTGFLAPDNLKTEVQRNKPFNTLLTRASLVSGYGRQPFRLYLDNWQDSLMINGKPMIKWNESEEALNGYVYKINRLLYKPTRTLYDYLSSDPRFSMLLQAIDVSATYYTTDKRTSNNPQFINSLKGLKTTSVAGRHTLFAPTNNAFAASGFHTIQDIHDRINQSRPIKAPAYDENRYYLYPVSALDSILLPHGFSLLSTANSTNNQDAVFYSKDLLQYPEALSGFLTKGGQSSQPGPIILATSFRNDNGTVMVRNFYSPTSAWHPLAETDIECINGVIHVVDEALLLP